MRKLFLAAILGALAVPFVAPPMPALAGDFDPSGRGKKKKPPKPGGTKPGGTKPGGTTPGGANPGGAKPGISPGAATEPKPGKPGDDDKGKSSEALIERYTGIVLKQPGSPFPLQRLAQLYRERDGNLKKLVEELEKRSAQTGDDAWPAKVALAGVLKQDGRYDEAIKAYAVAIADKPKESAPVLALAQLEFDRGDKKAARGHYEKGLPLLKEAAEIEQTTRTLMQVCLDLKDLEAARTHHAALVKKSQSSLFVKAELGRELAARQMYEPAEAEFRELVKAASGDNRALAPALRDLGSTLGKQKKMTEAVETLKKALAVAGSSAGIRAEILAIMTDAFRAEGKLPELVTILEKEPGQDFHRLKTLAGLYEETGSVDKALVTYRKALSMDSSHVDTRVKIVHLLQTAGQLEEAIKEYEALVKAAPNNPDFVFELCETLIQRGDRPKALRLLKELEGRAQENDVLAAVADFYERVEEKEKAMAILQRLANAGGGDPTFLEDLGDRYYQAGEKRKALDTWAKIKTMVPNKARASAKLGEIYLDHDMPEEALAALREAVAAEPTSISFKKALAIALERTAPGTPFANDRFSEAVRIWEGLLREAKTDANLSREARTHIVSVWSVQKELANRLAPLKQRFEAEPPDLEAGRLLAEVQRKLAKLPEAEATLRAIAKKDPGDEASLLALERVLVQRQDLKGAIEVLQKLADRNDKSARQYYQRMAQYASELYLDDDAIKYAAKAVELSPEDANGHQKLGDRYKQRQDFPKAIAEYRQAIQKNDRLFTVYFDLAELLMSSSEVAEADRLFRRVIRASGDEELVARAARMSMQINLGKGTLESLERELLPVAVGNPQKPIYRRLLIELYGAMTLPLVQKVRLGDDPKKIAEARAQLSAIGARGLKPLLDALADDRDAQQRVAIEILAYVENKSAGATLFNFATGQADKQLRTRAMIAVGALRDPEMLPKLESMLSPKDRDVSLAPSDDLALAGTWAVARTKDPKAEELLLRLLASASPDVRAVAAVGLGLSKNKKHASALVKLARAVESGPTARAAALLSLGQLAGGVADAELQSLVSANLEANDLLLRRAALVVAARLATGKAAKGADQATLDALAQGILATDDSLREDAIAAAASLVSKTFVEKADPLPVPNGKLDARGILTGLLPETPSDALRADVLIVLRTQLTKAAIGAVATSPEKAAAIADNLSAGPVLTPFAKACASLPAETREKAELATRAILDGTIPGYVGLLKHPESNARIKAAQVLALAGSSASEAALAQALAEGDDDVKRAVLSALTSSQSDELTDAIAALAKTDKSWAVRARAAETLGRRAMWSSGKASHKDAAIRALAVVAHDDTYALVREAALVSLASLDRSAALPALKHASAKDSEARVRQVANAILTTPPDAAPAP